MEDEANHHQHHGWDPMEEVSKSILNTSFSKITVQDVLSGSNLSMEETLCPFNDGSGGCFKKTCFLKHVPYSSKDLNARPKLLTAVISKKEQICTVDTMATQTLPAVGSISKGLVTACLDPGYFYVVPEYGWKCLCDVTPKSSDSTSGSNCFRTLQENQTFLRNYSQTGNGKTFNFYSAGDLIAVKLTTKEGRKSFYRAVVLSETEVDDDEARPDQPVDVQLQLIDYGLSYLKKSVDTFVLPSELLRFSAMAYRCSLYGISPVMGSWSKSAIAHFTKLVSGCNVLLEVVKTSTQPLKRNRIDEDCVVVVNMYVKTEGDDFINVAQELISSGLGIPWNDGSL